MRVLLVHPSPLIFSEIYLRLEPLGVERVAAAVEAAGHDVRLLDLQVFPPRRLRSLVAAWQPEAIGFSLNYLANVPEVIDLAREAKASLPRCRVVVGGHSASFIAADLLAHAEGAIDCVVRGEGEGVDPARARGVRRRRRRSRRCPGVVTADGAGPPPLLIPEPRAAHARAPPHRAAPQVLHRRARPVRLDRVHARLPVGLRVLQRLDVLRPQLPQAVAARPRARTWPASASPTSSSSTTSPSSAPSTAWRSPTRSSAAASTSATTSRRAPTSCCATARCSRAGRSSALRYMFLGIEAIDEEGLEAPPQARAPGRERAGARGGARARARRSPSTSSPTRTGTSAASRSCASGRSSAGDRQHDDQHAVPRHRDLAHRVAPLHHARLPAVRRAARRAADAAAARSASTRSSSRPRTC